MASAKTGVHMVQLKKVQVPSRLQQGDKFFKVEDEVGLNQLNQVTLKVDARGFFIQIVSDNANVENELIDIALIRDTRTGKQAKLTRDNKAREASNLGSPKLSQLDRTFTVVLGSDFTNVNFINLSCDNKEQAQYWTEHVGKIAHNLLAVNASAYDFLYKSHTRIVLMADKDGRISTKNVIKTFAQHKEDKKRVESALEACGFPTGKNDSFPAEKFTEEVFFTFYKHLVTRKEVYKIFQKFVGTDSKDQSASSKKSKHGHEFKLSMLTGLKEDKHQNEDKLMSVDQFINFLNKEQRDPRLNEILYPYVDRTKGKEIINQFEPNKANAQNSMLSFDGFLSYLMSEDNSIIPPDKIVLNADMDQPLNHYFIKSSHNTYLSGNQYKGFTMVTDIPLKDVLEAIAECAFKTSDYPVILSLENHCSPKQQAKIAMYCKKIFGDMLLTDPLPSHPLRSGVPLPSPNQLIRKIIIKNKKRHHTQREKKRAATTAHSPTETASNSLSSGNGSPSRQNTTSTALAGSLPNQLSDANQTIGTPERRALRNLATNSSEESNTQDGSSGNQNSVQAVPQQPSQQTNNNSNNKDKGSTTPGSTNTSTTITQQTTTTATNTTQSVENALASCDLDEESDTSIDEDDGGPSSDAGNASIVLSSTASNQQPNASNLASNAAQTANLQATTTAQPKTAHIKESEAAEELSALVNYIEAAQFHTFEYAEKRNRSYEISSFSETQATNLLKERPVDFVNFNKRQLSRIYPRGTRLESSNFNPQLFWNAGCQMVALNYQTLDLGMQLNTGVFEYNGRSGYLLKPDFMRRADRKFDPFTESIVDGIIAGMVSIQVISGQLLSSDKRCGTYVEVDMFGLPADTSRRKRTRIVANNTLNPIYLTNDQESTFEFSKVRLPDLASIRLAAYEESGKLIGHRILPVVGLRPGYRHIPLKNENGQPLNYASLFVHIEVKDYVPHKLSALAEALANPIAYQSMIEKRSKQLEALTDDEGNKERVENEAADVEVDAEDNLQLGNININSIKTTSLASSKLDDSNKENLDKKLGDDEHEDTSASNVISLTKRMKSVRNFFAGSSSGSQSVTNQQSQQPSISSGLASTTVITANATVGQASSTALADSQVASSILNQTVLPNNLVNSSASVLASGLVAGTSIGLGDASLVNVVQNAAIQSGGAGLTLQRQDTQSNLGASNQLASSTKGNIADVTASNQLEISDVPSVLESPEVINQKPESLVKLREHKRVVKLQLEMDRELGALRKKHNRQLEKEISQMNQRRDKLMASQNKQKSLLAKTHSKLSRKSVSSDKNSESVDNLDQNESDLSAASSTTQLSPQNNTQTDQSAAFALRKNTSITSEIIDSSSQTNSSLTSQNSFTTSTLISQFQKKPSKPILTMNRRRQSLQFPTFPSFHRNLIKRQSEQNLQNDIHQNQAKLDDLHRTTAQTIMTLLKEQIRTEQEIFERYHEKLFAALEKTMVNSQNEQLDRLQSLHDNEVQTLMGRLNCQSKESIANFASVHKDKNEFARVKRELQQRLIDLAVSERQRFELLLERRRNELIAKQEQIKKDLNDYKETQYQEKSNEFMSRLQQFQVSSEQSDLQQFLDLVSQNCSRSSSARSSFTMSSGIFSSLTGQAGNVTNKRRSLVNLHSSGSCENSADGRGLQIAVVQSNFGNEQSIDQTQRNKHASAPDLDSDKQSRASLEQQSIMSQIQEERPASTLPETTSTKSSRSHHKKRSPSRTKEKK